MYPIIAKENTIIAVARMHQKGVEVDQLACGR